MAPSRITQHRSALRHGAHAVLLASALLCAACKPAPPVAFTRTQHEALDRAKAVEAQLARDAELQRQRIDDAAK